MNYDMSGQGLLRDFRNPLHCKHTRYITNTLFEQTREEWTTRTNKHTSTILL